MTAATYTRFELLRTARNRRFLVFSLGFPLVIYFLVAGPNRNEASLGGTGLSAPLYYMLGLAAFGTMNTMLATGARIAGERQTGWNRQLRITPLSPRAYFRAKILTSYALALVTIAVLYASGMALGVRLSLDTWAEMTGLVLIGLIPFAALGILFGHLFTTDSIGPVLGGSTAILAFLGGAWFPITGGVFHVIAESRPSYWLVAASRVGVGGQAWGVTGWLVIAAWTVVTAVLATRAYRRDTKRD